MIIHGNLSSFDTDGSFDMKDENGVEMFKVIRNNKYVSNKISITNNMNNTEYFGEIINNLKGEEFVLYENEAEILRIKHVPSIALPKFEIISSFGDFSVKLSVIKRSISVMDGKSEVMSASGSSTNYKIDIDDNSNAFYLMSIVYGIRMIALDNVHNIK